MSDVTLEKERQESSVTKFKYDIKIKCEKNGCIVRTTAFGHDEFEAQQNALKMHPGTVVGCVRSFP